MIFNSTNFSNFSNSNNLNISNNTSDHYKKSIYDKILHSIFIYNFFFIIILCAITPVIIYCTVCILDLLHELMSKINHLIYRKKKRNTFIVEMGNMEHRIVCKKNDKG